MLTEGEVSLSRAVAGCGVRTRNAEGQSASPLHPSISTKSHCHKRTQKQDIQGKPQGNEPFQPKSAFSKVASYKINTQTLWLAKHPKIVVTKYTGGKKDPIHDSARDEKFLGVN